MHLSYKCEMCGAQFGIPTELHQENIKDVLIFLNLQVSADGKYVQQFVTHPCSDKVTGIARLRGFVHI